MKKAAMSTDAYLTNAPHQNYYVRIEMQYSTVLEFPVKIYNITAKPVIIKFKSVFCELREVKVIRDGFESDDQARPVTLNITEGHHP
jgi:hypothetical protein